MVQENIQELNFANVIGDRFGRYSKYIIQDRALPDIRDGLKPVQRRILYAMYMDRNTAANPYRKSAKTVGNVIGNYHPHGDSSVYEAMVRMSQDWKLRETLIDMHGNNGSMDGDPAAAMRYTEARLSPIADELLRDIQHQTVDYLLNFDDTLEEPTVLPARIPNLLVNGATGISAGYATEIPPHNLAEVIDALVYMLSHKRYQLSDILQFVQAPDFPTGAIIQGADQIRKAYETGQGKIIVRSVTEIEQLKGNKQQIVIHELPYEVNKAKLIQRLDDIRIQRKIEGIADVRDESDRNGVRVVIELKREVNAEGILQYLLKNTDLQVNYHFNMVAIHERRPMVVGLMQMLEAYLAHQKEVLTKRTEHMLAADKKRLHIVDGLIRVVSILDEVIALIRASENKADAKRNLEREFEFSPEQSESIVNLQLYRLTNTDIEALQNEKLELNERILMYQNILNNEETLKKVLANELKDIKKRYQTLRRTRVQAEVEEITVETSILIPDEQVYVSVTKEGYIKRTSVRSFTASDAQDLGSRELDYPIFVQEMSTHDAIVLVTNKGNYIHLPVHELPDIRWKDMGMHLSTNYRLEDGEQLIAAFKSVMDASTLTGDDNPTLVMTTRKGMIKQTTLDQFTTYRSYKTKTATAMKLKDDQDAVITVAKAKPDVTYEVIVITERSYGVRYDLSEVPVSGMKAQGVVAIKLKDDDKVMASLLIDTAIERPQLLALTQRAHLKRFDVEVVAKVSNRSSRGHLLLKELKANPHRFIQVIALTKGNIPIVVLGDTGKTLEVKAFDTPISDRLSNGSLLHDAEMLGQVISLYPARLKMLDEE
ncbi:DNA topoisomerase IV subunit A [Aerococcaceae bacterium zg-ZJ1578]|uniref:DNA topoisomerase IV subunit A n=1 Tax=Aerococcaceae bacterium zg-252 TaxID=2796928 RepID=UPI001A34AF27|nr:DNA topoisomerase IV subunit A [Aerococcaceae bacterium zg-1578]